MITVELAWERRKDVEGVTAKQHLSADSCGHRRTGRPNLDWLDCMMDALRSDGVRNCRRREEDPEKRWKAASTEEIKAHPAFVSRCYIMVLE